jgi:hypothetical protein
MVELAFLSNSLWRDEMTRRRDRVLKIEAERGALN